MSNARPVGDFVLRRTERSTASVRSAATRIILYSLVFWLFLALALDYAQAETAATPLPAGSNQVLPSPSLDITTPAAGQVLRVGEKNAVVWTLGSGEKPKKAIVTLRKANGKIIAKKRVKPGMGFYIFRVKQKYRGRLALVMVCQLRTRTSAKACDTKPVTVMAADVPTPTPPLSDDFNDGNADGWTVVDDTEDSASDWRVVDGQYRQLNFIRLDTHAVQKAYNLGSFAYLSRALNLANYRFGVTATPLSSSGQDIGVLFRYRDRDNYYRLILSAANGFTRVERKLAGEFTTVAKTARGYVRGVPLNILVTAQGNLFRIDVNGERLFSFFDYTLPSGSVALYCRDNCAFDDIRLARPSSKPSIAVSKPESYAVASSRTFTTSAVVLNKPADATVVFSVGGRRRACRVAREKQAGLFETQCVAPDAAPATAVTAKLVRSGTHLDSATHSDIAFGDQYIAVGDSITFGLYDNYTADDKDPHGLAISSGYTSVLTDLLFGAGSSTASLVSNNGIPGARSSDTFSDFIDPILTRHGDAQYVLLLLGTNDIAAHLSSGQGCTVNCAGTFKANMQAVIDKIVAAGKTPVVARLLPRFGNDTTTYADPRGELENQIIASKYNRIIASELQNVIVGPNFYDFFLNARVNRFNLFANYLHPNGLGYRVMAGLWYQQLTGKNDGLPFILDNLCVRPLGDTCQAPSFYQQNLLETGNAYYVDQAFQLTGIPPELKEGVWIMPANADKTAAAANYMEFSFAGSATVYVAYDDGAGSIPQWLNGFARTDSLVTTTNPAAPAMRLYRLDNAQGSVVLGGNSAPGATGTAENYSVIVVPSP